MPDFSENVEVTDVLFTVIRCLKSGKSPQEIAEFNGYSFEIIDEIAKNI